MITLELDDPCPCGRGRIIRDCGCLRPDKTFRPFPAVTEAPGPVTNFAHPKCFARPTKNCSTALSKEHVISHGILRALTSSKGVQIFGTAFNRHDGGLWVSARNLASHILCERHNNALSPLDGVAI